MIIPLRQGPGSSCLNAFSKILSIGVKSVKNNAAQRGALAAIIFSMTLFGTIGLFVRWIPLPSATVALVRGAVGTVFLLAWMKLKGLKPDAAAVKKNLPLLCVSGAAIGFNWILLFESYRYTTVSTATLCYYMAPVLITMASPLVCGERLTARRLACVAAAVLGMALVSGVIPGGGLPVGQGKGVLLGLGAAVLYATVILLNKRISGLEAAPRTMLQLAAAAVVLVPYVLVTGVTDADGWGNLPLTLVLLAVVGVLHTGFAYKLYFGSIQVLPVQTAAMLSYIDPVVAILLSALLLREAMSLPQALGAVLVLGSALVGELPGKKC